MTTGNDPDTVSSLVAWLEGEVQALKAKVIDLEAQHQEDRARLWQLTEVSQRSEGGAANVAAQLQILSGLPEEVRLLRERSERLQAAVGQDSEQMELLGRQLRTEMQVERDDRGELRRRTEFAEQAALAGTEKVNVSEEITRRLQETVSLISQRLEQNDINVTGLDARLAASGEALRRMQDDARSTASELDRYEHLLGEIGDRMDRYNEVARRLQEHSSAAQDAQEESDALRDRFEAMRVNNDQALNQISGMQTEHELVQARFGELDRALERSRTRDEQHDRALSELKTAFDDLREAMQRDSERLLGFQEKLRRRQISDMEQEIREIRGHIRAQTESNNA